MVSTNGLRRLALPGGSLFLAMLIGIAVAIASSPGSFITHAGSRSAKRAPEAAVPTPKPSARALPAAPGVLGDSPALLYAAKSLFASGSAGSWQSDDFGRTWTAVVLPAGAGGLAVDPSDAGHRITGGNGVQVTTDGGKNWSAPKARPPGTAPYQPLAINGGDPAVWFFAAGGHVIRTRDAGISWRQLPVISISTAPVMVVLGGDRFLVGSGSTVYQLSDNGNTIQQYEPLPGDAQVRELAILGGDFDSPVLARAGDGNVYIHRHNGWTPVPDVGGPVAAKGTSGWVGNGGSKLGSAAAIVFTSDAGASWKEATGLPADETVEAITPDPAADGAVIAYLYGGDIYRSADDGANWNPVAQSLRPGS
jgi:photosystem II stability/assembly factor-like uncharacterized protein